MKAKKYTHEDMEMTSALNGLAHVITIDDENRAELEANTALLASEPEWRAFCDEFEKSYRTLAQAQDRRRAVVAFAGKCSTGP